jgi:glycosyltransferase involved in cell wall biosynthesis
MPPKPGLRVLVATPYGSEGKGGIDRLNDAIFSAIAGRDDASDVVMSRLVTRGKKGLVAAQFVFACALARFFAAGLSRRVDILHIHLSDGGSIYRKCALGVLSSWFRIPYVVHLHGVRYQEFWVNASPMLTPWIARLFRRSSRILVLGDYWAKVVSSALPELVDKVFVLPNASKASQRAIATQDQPTKVLFLGQLGARKGAHVLISALARASKGPWQATLAGDGAVDEFRTLVQHLELAERVKILGWQSDAEVACLLRSADVLVLPSFAENLPMAIIEAFGHGVPVIATPVGAIPEVVTHYVNGILVPVGDVEALAAAIERIVADRPLREALGAQAKADHAKKFDFDTYVQKLLGIWRSSVASHGPSMSKPGRVQTRPQNAS